MKIFQPINDEFVEISLMKLKTNEVNQKLNILGYIYKFRPHGNAHDILDGKIINLFFGRCGHKRGSRHLVLQWSKNHIYSVLSRKDL